MGTALLFAGSFTDSASAAHTVAGAASYLIDALQVTYAFFNTPAAGSPTFIITLQANLSAVLTTLWQDELFPTVNASTFPNLERHMIWYRGLNIARGSSIQIITTLSSINSCVYSVNLYGRSVL